MKTAGSATWKKYFKTKLHSIRGSVPHRCIMAKQFFFFLTETYEHGISGKANAMYEHLKACKILISIRNLCNLPDTLDSNKFPPNFSCNKKMFPTSSQKKHHSITLQRNTFIYQPLDSNAADNFCSFLFASSLHCY